jgi:hypothetical protein
MNDWFVMIFYRIGKKVFHMRVKTFYWKLEKYGSLFSYFKPCLN